MSESTSSAELLASLQNRARNLLEELRAFQTFLHTQNTADSVEINHFKNNVQSEVKSLARIIEKDVAVSENEELEAKRLHMLHSTNLPFYEAVWDAAKRCRGVVALEKRIHWVHGVNANDRLKKPSTSRLKPISKVSVSSALKKSVLIDVVANDGLEWVKVSTITAKRLLFEIAKEGWEKYTDSDSEGSDSGVVADKPDIELVRLARDLYAASFQVRVRYQHPRVHLLLPKITEGANVDIDAILRDLRKTGVLAETGGRPELSKSSGRWLVGGSVNFAQMLTRPAMPLTSTINVDCTLLLALISDISHVPPSVLQDLPLLSNNGRSYHSAILRQIVAEKSLPLLPTELYPILISRRLICKTYAARRACEIVDTMGTSTERLRTDIVLGQGDYTAMGEMQLRRELKKHSVHPVPDELHIAISQIDFESEDAFSLSLSEHLAFPTTIAKRAVEKMAMSTINRTVFLYGWRENFVTVTSNSAIARRLVLTINSVLDDEERVAILEGTAIENQVEFQGPRIWICETARSLIGKHKSNGKSLDS